MFFSRYNAWLYDALLLKNWILIRNQRINNAELVETATLFLDLWLKQGVQADGYLLERARALFEMYFKFVGRENCHNVQTFLRYCNVLQNMGDHKAASVVIKQVLTLFDSDADYPNYLFYAGVIFKAMGDSDAANNYFFESCQIGPPKLFSKIEMMAIISRNLEGTYYWCGNCGYCC